MAARGSASRFSRFYTAFLGAMIAAGLAVGLVLTGELPDGTAGALQLVGLGAAALLLVGAAVGAGSGDPGWLRWAGFGAAFLLLAAVLVVPTAAAVVFGLAALFNVALFLHELGRPARA